MKFKRKVRKVIKRLDGDVYVFRNGIAIVPDCWWQKQPMKVSLTDFMEMRK